MIRILREYERAMIFRLGMVLQHCTFGSASFKHLLSAER